jgi:cytochrome P450
MSKGQMIYVPVAAVNRDPRIWGPDAAEFKYTYFTQSAINRLLIHSFGLV